ncbi:MAG: Crp/Fnr family transcriptional regulator [Marinifilaceae bacterium]
MLSRLLKSIEQYGFYEEMDVSAKTVLLAEGTVSKKMYWVKKGALRMWFNKDGKDVTTQFFFEGQLVSSIHSFMNGSPSLFSIESIEHSKVLVIDKHVIDELMLVHPEMKDEVFNFVTERFQHYVELFLSRIKDSPQERYEELLRECPQVVQRVPQHYIASYLGITSVSLSRIRNRR